MTWLIGIDEAGYGPNIGPFVMSAVACRLTGDVPACLWAALADAVRKAGGRSKDKRLIIDDSKRVYGGGKGLSGLERGVFTVLGHIPPTLNALTAGLCPDDTAELSGEVWFRGETALPVEVAGDALSELREPFRLACEKAGVAEWRVRSAVVCPGRFNRVVERAGTKSVVLADGFVRLLGELTTACHQGRVEACVDKQGGRNAYLMQVQQAVGGLVRVLAEGDECSRYEAVREDRTVRVTFEPRADSGNLCVALASMVSKYLRELFMGELNAFWKSHVPDLEPTAGYPGDAGRFLEAILPVATRLEVPHDAIWRCR
jgi:ribonuclease HII